MPPVALRLALAMLCLQAGIGATNDLVDADTDAAAKPWKPIPAGLVGERGAERFLAVALAAGLGLSALSGLAVFAVAVVGTAIGLTYDLRLKGTAWSWLPFAVGIPLLPLYGWLGSGAPVPAPLLALVVLAVPAGAALAIANALADLPSDVAAGVGSVAARLGRGRAWAMGAVLQAVAVVGAAGCAIVAGASGGSSVPASAAGDLVGRAAALALPAVVVAIGLLLGRSARPVTARRGWEVQAVGLACLAVIWLLEVPLVP